MTFARQTGCLPQMRGFTVHLDIPMDMVVGLLCAVMCLLNDGGVGSRSKLAGEGRKHNLKGEASFLELFSRFLVWLSQIMSGR